MLKPFAPAVLFGRTRRGSTWRTNARHTRTRAVHAQRPLPENPVTRSFASACRLLLSVAAVSVLVNHPAFAQTPDGAAVFQRECAICHTGAPDTRAPSPDTLRRRSPEAILTALTAGGMRPQGGRLTGAERRAVAEYITGRVLGGDATGATVGRCTTTPPFTDRKSVV